jgi:cytochrome c553
MHMWKYTLAAGALLLLIDSGAASAQVQGNAEAGRAKAAMCQGCHGIADYHVAFPYVYNVPKLGGQHAQYITAALHEYKSGERSFPTMRAVAASLSDQDMADLAAYYSAADSKTAAK